MTLRALMPTDIWIRRLLVPVVVFVAMVSDHGYLCDFWHHLARGRAMAETGGLVDQDIFTFTIRGEHFQDVNWLSQLLYYGLFQLGGLGLVQVVNALVLAATLALLIEVSRRACGSLFWASMVAVGVFVGIWQLLSLRPQTFSMFLFVLLLDILERSRRRPWLLVLPPLIIALWTNLHGAFPAGLMLIGCFFLAACGDQFLCSRIRKNAGEASDARILANAATGATAPHRIALALCLGASTLATLVNPYGWGIYRYVLHTSQRASQRQIDEWLPPSLDMWIGRAFFISLAVLGVLLVLAWRKGYRPRLLDILLLGCFLPMACTSVRMVAWWLLILAPMAATLLVVICRQTGVEEESPQPSLATGLTFAALLLTAIFSLPGLQEYNPLLRLRQQPRVEDDLEAAYAHLRTLQPSGHVFARFEWGEYLSWTFAPSFQVFMDGRIELYPDDVWDDYSTVTRGSENWQKVLDDRQVDVLVLDAEYHARTGLFSKVNSSPHWHRHFTSRNVAVYLRTRGE